MQRARQGYFQKAEDTARYAGAGAKRRRQQVYVTFANEIADTGVLEPTLPRKAHEHTGELRGPDDE